MRKINHPNYWTKEEIQKEANKYKTISDWRKGSIGSYNSAWKKKNINQYTSHMILKKKFWTKKECWEACLNYKNLTDWKSNDVSSYHFSKKKGYFKIFKQKRGFPVLTQRGYWNSYNLCVLEANKYSIKSDWIKTRSYRTIQKNNPQWIPKLSKHMLQRKVTWTKKECLEEAKKYKSVTEWREKSSTSYRIAKENGSYKKCAKALGVNKKPAGYWNNYERCKKEALKYKHRAAWMRGSGSSYESAKKHGWINNLSKHMMTTSEITSLNNTKWSLKKCKQIAKKYKTKSQWQKGHIYSYNSASRRGWLDICGKHMKSAFKWNTKEKCLKEAKKYKRITDWIKYSNSSYVRACRKGWHKECTAHMKKYRTLEDCKKDALKYKTKNEWLLKSPGAYWSAYSRGFYAQCTKHMIDQPNCNLREKRALKKFIKLIKKEIKNCIIEKEPMISRNSVPDLVVHINNKVFVIELKHDDSQWRKTRLKNQLQKYEQNAKIKYGKNYQNCLIASPKGKYGMSFNEVINHLKQQI